MPELPEVETVRCQLARSLPGREIAAVVRMDPFMLLEPEPEEFAATLPGRRLLDVGRRGKFLLISLSGDLYLTIHLGMTGQLLVLPGPDPAPTPHDRYVIGLGEPIPDPEPGPTSGAGSGPGMEIRARAPSSGAVGAGVDTGVIPVSGRFSPASLVFRDMRKFGRVHLTAGRPAARVYEMGPDAWPGGDWSTADLAAMLRGRRAPLKAFLLDQRRLAGIGNIYADEILFAARLSPLRPAGSLRPREIRRLAEQISLRLNDGVRLRGCSISDFVDTGGRSGDFQSDLRAYGRQGQPCFTCGRPLVRVIVAGRGTAYCPRCQR